MHSAAALSAPSSSSLLPASRVLRRPLIGPRHPPAGRAGFCADGDSNSGDDVIKVEDSYQTWDAQLARLFDAEIHVQAVSGWGVGWTSGVSTSATPIQGILDYTNGPAMKQKWDYSSWTPDAVVILIGPNDESRSFYNTTGGAFVKAYLSLMTQVAKNYAHASPPPKIVHVCGGSGNGFDPCDDIQTANKQFNERSTGMKGY